jgi:hypothetical protein
MTQQFLANWGKPWVGVSLERQAFQLNVTWLMKRKVKKMWVRKKKMS